MLANFSGGSRILNRGVQRKTALLRVVKFLTPPICRPRLLAPKKKKKKKKSSFGTNETSGTKKHFCFIR